MTFKGLPVSFCRPCRQVVLTASGCGRFPYLIFIASHCPFQRHLPLPCPPCLTMSPLPSQLSYEPPSAPTVPLVLSLSQPFLWLHTFALGAHSQCSCPCAFTPLHSTQAHNRYNRYPTCVMDHRAYDTTLAGSVISERSRPRMDSVFLLQTKQTEPAACLGAHYAGS